MCGFALASCGIHTWHCRGPLLHCKLTVSIGVCSRSNSDLIVENTLAQYRPITTACKTILHILYTVDKPMKPKGLI